MLTRSQLCPTNYTRGSGGGTIGDGGHDGADDGLVVVGWYEW